MALVKNREANAVINNDSRNVSVGKGKVGAYLLSAPAGTTLPTDASTALGADFANLGYVTSDGITINRETESNDFKDLSGDTVLTVISSVKDTVGFNLMETRTAALKEIYGQSNVTETTATGTTKITVSQDSNELPQRAYVMEFALTGGRKMRKVIPLGKITELGEQTYQSGEAISYPATLTCAPDTNGKTMYTYIEYTTPTTEEENVKKGA